MTTQNLSRSGPPPHPNQTRNLDAPLAELISRQVGKRTLASVSDEMRRCMLMEALRQANGNVTNTAQLLGVTRQAVQFMLAHFGLRPWAVKLRHYAEQREAHSPS